MIAPRLFILITLACSLCAQGLFAQGLILRDSSRIQTGLAAYDQARGRVVELGKQGETREFDGTTFFRRPSIGPRFFGHLIYRSATASILAYGQHFDDAQMAWVRSMWRYDGADWQLLQPASLPSAQFATSMTYDTQRDRVVLFGGTSTTGTAPGETWEWDGTTWTVRATSGPLPRVAASMAYDSVRGVCVMFGGQVSGAGLQNDHWEWDGTTWTQRTLALTPSARKSALMTFDRTRGVTVLYGGVSATLGSFSELWEFDGSNWQPVTYGTGPGDRYQGDLLYDSSSGTTLLVGLGASQRHEHWHWNGTTWQLTVDRPASSRESVYASSAFDPIDGSVLTVGSLFGNTTSRYLNGEWSFIASTLPTRAEPIMWSDGVQTWLFGGGDLLGSGGLNDTWRWNGTTWLQHTPTTSPTPRSNCGVAYDSTRGEAVIFGGSSAASQPDTWTFDGVNWQQKSPTTTPPTRLHPGMAYDPVRDRVVMFGGRNSIGVALNDTWEWNGSNWSLTTTPVTPPGALAAAMEYEPSRGGVVMSRSANSIQGGATLITVWVYDGSNWTSLPLAEPRWALQRHELIRIPNSGAMLLVDSGSVLELLDQPGSVATVGTGCGSPAPMLSLRDRPALDNAEFGLDLISAAPTTMAVIAGSDSSTSQPLLGCTVYLGATLVSVTEMTNTGGFMSYDLPIPNQPNLLGTNWFFQGAVLQPNAPFGIAFSAGLAVEIGSR